MTDRYSVNGNTFTFGEGEADGSLSIRNGRVTLEQPDGSSGMICGNALAVAAQIEDRELLAMGDSAFDVSTTGDWSRVVFDNITTEQYEQVLLVDVGVPHVVEYSATIENVDIQNRAERLREIPYVPDRSNVTLVSSKDLATYNQRTYERGVEAETNACGTGAVSIGAWFRELDRYGNLEIRQRGGSAMVEVLDDYIALNVPVERL